jgi:predicted kinase
MRKSMIICITGLAGSGKTTIADFLEGQLKSLNYTVFHFTSDWIAQKIFASKYSNLENLDVDYTNEELDCIYNTLFMLFEQILLANPNVIIITDGMYRKTSYRLILQLIASRLQTKFILIKAETPIALSKQRLEKRKKLTGFGGWADPELYENPDYELALEVNNTKGFKELNKKIENILKKYRLDQFHINKY